MGAQVIRTTFCRSIRAFPKLKGTILGVPLRIMIVLLGGLYWAGIGGNYHMRFLAHLGLVS